MTDKKTSSKTSKLKNFLVTGSVDKGDGSEYEEDMYQEEVYVPEEQVQEGEVLFEEETVVIEDVTEEPVQKEPPVLDMPSSCAPLPEEQPSAPPAAYTAQLEKEIAELKGMVADLTAELGRYATTKEQLKEYTAVVGRRDTELANRKFIGMLEQLSAMREDFFKLCTGIESKLGSFSPKDVLSSFEAYGVDMENILVDCGVQIGASKFEKLNTMHQRIVDVIPTDEEGMNGMIAERMSDGYVYQGRVLLKEKVKIYRYSENGKAEGDEEK